MKTLIKARPKIPAPFPAFPLLFLCLAATPLLAQGPTAEVRNAAAGGNAQAQFALGDYYFEIRFATLDYEQVMSWYRKSAAQGFAPAQN